MGQVIVWLIMMFLAYAYMIAVRLHFTYSMMVMMKSPLVAAPHNDHCPDVEINVGINSTIDEKRMDWSLEEQSITMSAYFIGMLFTVFPGGVYANRGYEREIMGMCMFVSAVSVIFCPIAAVKLNSWIAVFVLRFFVGCSFGPVAPCGGTIAGKIIPKSSRALFSTFMFSGTIFGAFSGHLFSGLIIPKTSHSWSYFILGIFAILWSIIWMVMFCKMPYKVLEDASNHSLSVFSTPWKTVLQSEAYISLLIASLGFGNLYSFITTGLPIYSARVLGGDAVKNGINVCQPWFICWITSITVGLLSMELIVTNTLRKNTVRKLYAGVVLIVCPLMVLSIRLSNCHMSQTKTFIWMAIILLSFERNSIRINSLDLCPKFAGSLIALSDVFFSVGNVLDLFVARNIHIKDFDWNFVFYIATFFPIVCSVPFLVFGTAAHQSHWELVRYRRSSVTT